MKKLLYIGNKLSRHGVNVTTIETLGPLLEREGFAVSYASSKKNQFLRLLDMLWSVFKERKSNFVIIDTYSTAGFWYAFATSQLCRLLKLKYIPILHGGNLPSRLEKNKIFCRMIFNHSFCNVSPSEYLFKEFQNRDYPNLTYIPNSIEIDNYTFLSRSSLGPKILWVRSFDKIYNPIMAIEVLSKLKKTFPEAKLCMVGGDKGGGLFETQQKANELELNVLFTGILTKPEWIKLSREYDIFINTTHFDNMPISVIEAMSLGLAVVSTNVGGIPYLLENDKDSILVPDNGADEMAQGIRKIIENQNLFRQVTIEARKKAESLDWQCVKNKWVDVLQ